MRSRRPRPVGPCLVWLAAACALAGPARAQLPFPVPPPAGVLVAPLLLLLPLAHEWARSDRDRVRELERRHDWRGLETLADRRLAAAPGDARWLGLRGRARLFLGRWDAAAPDLRAAFEAEDDRPAAQRFDVGLAWALAEALRPGGRDIAATLDALDALLPGRPEPAALRQALAAAPAVPAPAPGLRLPVAAQAVELPGAGWQPVPTADPPPLRGGPNLQFVRAQAIALRAAAAEARVDGVLRGRLWLATHAARAWGVSVWDVDDPCRRPGAGAVLVESVALSIQQPDCLTLRALPAGEPMPGLADARPADEAGWLFAYDRFGMDGVVQARLWLPQSRLPGPLLAALWARAWAAGLRPWADPPSPAPAMLPPLRP